MKKVLQLIVLLSFIINCLAQKNSYSGIQLNFYSENNGSLNDRNSTNTQENQKSNISFTPNKGQIADMKGIVCPDVLYKSNGGDVDVFLRKSGISYVLSNMTQVMEKAEKQMEDMEHSIGFNQDAFQQKKLN
ncbi:MAG: hypothetical protein JNL63_07700 [Bacteroidia bacterium]|nr:hypothetical protein [Bacteroidia bacterium]